MNKPEVTIEELAALLKDIRGELETVNAQLSHLAANQ